METVILFFFLLNDTYKILQALISKKLKAKNVDC